MTVTIKQVTAAFELFYESMHSRAYRKSLDLHSCGERKLLPVVRSFLLGYFGRIVPELSVGAPGSPSGVGRIDFCIDKIAVEFAVRKPLGSKVNLSAVANASEIKKLLTYDGPAVLILYDFSRTPFTDQELNRFREWPSLAGLGKGSAPSAFNVAYYYVESVNPKKNLALIRKTIRVR